MDSLEPDMIVWVRLGGLHGWWPAIYQRVNFVPIKKEFPDLKIETSRTGPTVPSNSQTRPILGYVRFFDDEKFDLFPIRDPEDVKPYSCEDKLTVIKNGLKKFEPKKEAKKKGRGKRSKGQPKGNPQPEPGALGLHPPERKKDGLFDLRARLAQFYKDVELAEVMTDNSPKVGQILQRYEIEGEDWDPPQGEDEDAAAPTENLNPNSGQGSKRKATTSAKRPSAKKNKT